MAEPRAWMTVPGIREGGDRTIAEQMIGLDRALGEAHDKTVLDMGCAEAAIALEFARAGARDVLGMEILETHLEVARKLCADWPQIRLQQVDFRKYLPRVVKTGKMFDIVLALAIIQKMHRPDVVLQFAAQSAKSLVVLRLPAWSRDGMVRYKYGTDQCHVPTVMANEGFELEFEIMGPRSEPVEYWRRIRPR